MKLEVGQVLSGTLRLVRKIAEGGMGSVWIAEHLVLERPVAVKFMSGPWAALPTARSRFLREARMTAHIESPHVVKVLDCRHTESDEPYLVLELLKGETLEHLIRHGEALPVFQVADIVNQCCEALAAVHAAGVVHRDIKPENVFLCSGPAPFVKLLDFGVARPLSRTECREADLLVAGTPQYMSPEQMFEPERTDARSDLFSLAAVVYFALTRRTPFDAESLEGLYFAIDAGTFKRPSELRPELPPALDDWFERALAHDAKDRFVDAREMARAFSEIVHHTSSASFAVTGTTRDRDSLTGLEQPVITEPQVPRRRIQRSRRSAVAALAFAAATGLLLWRESQVDLDAPFEPPTTSTEYVDASPDSEPRERYERFGKNAEQPPPDPTVLAAHSADER